jgi:hypothetical protein
VLVALGVVLAGAGALAAVVDRPGAPAPGPTGTVEVPPAGALGAAWVCAEGTGDPSGRVPGTVWLANPSSRPAAAQVRLQADGRELGRRDVALGPWSVAALPVAEIGAHPDPVILVESSGGRVVVAHVITAAGDVGVAPCRRPPVRATYAAGLTTLRGAQAVVALANPFPDDAIVDVSALTLRGPQAPERLQGIIVARRSRITVPLGEFVRRQAPVAVQVTTRRGRVVTELSLRLDGVEGRRGFALSPGLDAPARRFGFPAGATSPGRTQELVLANPGDAAARVRVRVRLDGRARLAPRDLVVPARSLVAVDAGERVPAGTGYHVAVRADRPVVAQMLVSSREPAAAASRGIAWPAGQPRAARRWVIVPARVTSRSSDVLAVANARRRPVRVRVWAFGDGDRRPVAGAGGVVVPAGRRRVVDLAGVRAEAGLLIEADGRVWVSRDAWAAPGISVGGGVADAGSDEVRSSGLR